MVVRICKKLVKNYSYKIVTWKHPGAKSYDYSKQGNMDPAGFDFFLDTLTLRVLFFVERLKRREGIQKYLNREVKMGYLGSSFFYNIVFSSLLSYCTFLSP